jgi:lysophospholipase L1-like esterase
MREKLSIFAIVGGIPILLAADTITAFLRGWSTQSRFDRFVILAIVMALVAALVIVGFSGTRKLAIQRRPQLLACLIATICAWVAVEYLCRVYLSSADSTLFHRRPAGTIWKFYPSPAILPGISGESRSTINSLGIRGPEMPARSNAYRILCVGGSTTECLYLDDAETWPHLLMTNLNRKESGQRVWVGNVGISGFSTVRHHQFIVEEDLWKQMDCLVFLIGANDFNVFLRAGIAMREVAELRLKKDSELRPLQPTWKKSAVLNLARKTYGDWTRSRIDFEDATGENIVARRKARQSAVIHEELPDLSVALDQYEERVSDIIDHCRAANVRCVFCTQPVLYGPDVPPEVEALFWLGHDGRGGNYQMDDLAKGLAQYNERLTKICAREKVLCIDLTSMNTHPEYFYDEYHFNEAGARAVARLVALGMSSVSFDKPR